MSNDQEDTVHEVVLRDPASILKKQFGSEFEILKIESEPLTKYGDNFGSTMLKVRLSCKMAKDKPEEELNLVAKLLPKSERSRKVFDIKFTYKKEVFLYEDLIPTYQQIYAPQGDFDVVPKFFGARLSLDETKREIDDDAVILLENLKHRVYYMGDKYKGLDLDHLKATIKVLAQFHAIGLTVKSKKPSFIEKLRINAKPISSDPKLMQPYMEMILETVKSDEFLSNYYKEIKTIDENCVNSFPFRLDANDPWATIVHNDFWVNNVLFHQKDEASIDGVKIVDFQTFFISSPLTDLVFFLCTSMGVPFENFDELLELYRETAVEILRKLDSSSVNLFEKNKFEDRLKIDAPTELLHIMFMSRVVELRAGEDIENLYVNEHWLRRIREVVKIFAKKMWI